MIQARLHRSMCATIGVGIVAFAIADGAWFLFLLGLTIPATAWLAGRPDPANPEAGPWTLPRWLVTLLVFLSIASALLRATILRDGTPLVSNLGAFLTYVQLIKLFDRRTSRDEAQLLGLSVFTAIAAILTDNSLLLGVTLAVYTPLAVSAAMRMEIGAGRDLGGGATVMTGRALWGDLRKAVGASVVCACLLAAAVFLAAPRGVGSDWLGTFGVVRGAQVGFTDDIRLGQQGNLNERPTPVLELMVTDNEGRNIGDPTRAIYLRGATRDVYGDRGMWTSSTEAARRPRQTVIPGGELRLGDPGPRPSFIRQTVTMRARIRGSDDYVFCAWRPVSMKFAQEIEVSISQADLSVKQRESNLRWAGRLQYEVLSAVTDAEQPGDEPFVSRRFETGPIAELARRVIAERAGAAAVAANADDPLAGMDLRQAASVLRDHLRLNYDYSLEMTMPREGQDPIEMFLFDTRRGHCEYFASALVAMCQSVGIPARIVAGYMATEHSPLTGQYTVRESNAHAWAEVWVGPGRWLTMDPSPPGDIERIHARPTGLLSRLKSWYDLLEFNWNEAIVTFDSASQSRLFRPYEDGTGMFSRLGERVQGGVRSIARRLGLISGEDAVSVVWRVVWWCAVGIVIGAAAWVVWMRVRGLARGRRGGGAVDAEMRRLLAQAGFYPRALRKLERAGIGKPRGRSGRAHAAWLRGRGEPDGETLGVLAGLYYRVRFGRERLSDAEISEARAALAAMGTRAGHGAGRGPHESERPA